MALIVAYALDLLGTVHGGEIATRALLYLWLFVGIPAGVSIGVNLLLAPPPRLSSPSRRSPGVLCLAATMLRAPGGSIRRDFHRMLARGKWRIAEVAEACLQSRKAAARERH